MVADRLRAQAVFIRHGLPPPADRLREANLLEMLADCCEAIAGQDCCIDSVYDANPPCGDDHCPRCVLLARIGKLA